MKYFRNTELFCQLSFYDLLIFILICRLAALIVDLLLRTYDAVTDAMDYRKQGVPILQATQEAGKVRFRPIMMTALAFVFGVMPMLFATGPGANSRKVLGAAVVFGMAMNAFIGTLFVPNFWALMQTLNEKITARFHPKKS